MRGISILGLVGLALALPGPTPALADEDGSARGALRSLHYLPADALMAVAHRQVDLGALFDGLIEFADELDPELDFEAGLAPLRAWEEEVGVSLRDDLLGQLQGEIALALALDGIDPLVAAVTAAASGETASLDRQMRGLVLVADVVDPARLDRGLEKALAGTSVALKVGEDGLRTLAAREDGLPLAFHYRYDGKRMVAGLSRAAVDAALRRSEDGSGLPSGPDFAKIVSRVAPHPDSLSYVNLPRFKTLLESSPMVQIGMGTDPDLTRIYQMFVSRPAWPQGALWASYRVEGGTVRQSYFPESGGLPPLMDSYLGATSGGSLFLTGAIAAVAVPNFLSAVDKAKQKRTMADIRSLGTGCEAYRIDEGSYPGPTAGWVHASWLDGSLTPAYMRRVPREDGWGQPLYYWSNGDAYVLLSYGKDDIRDWEPAQDSAARSTTGFDADLVYRDGAFIRYPSGLEE